MREKHGERDRGVMARERKGETKKQGRAGNLTAINSFEGKHVLEETCNQTRDDGLSAPVLA
jgi:hypothetical protein